MDGIDILKMHYVVLETHIDDLMDEIQNNKDFKRAEALTSVFKQMDELIKEIKKDDDNEKFN